MDEKLYREITRYLGYRSITPDEEINRMIEECVTSLREKCTPRTIYRYFPISWTDDELPDAIIGDAHFPGGDLARNLAGCSEAAVLAATLGPECDMLVRRAEVTSMARAAVYQASGAALIEEVVDDLNRKIIDECKARGLSCRPRYSPGYGDVPLWTQREVEHLIGMQRNVGITLSESYIMTPSKSVTAFIGVSDKEQNCVIEGCEACSMKDSCSYTSA